MTGEPKLERLSQTIERALTESRDAAVRRHADLILRASGSALKNYEMHGTRRAILSAVMDCYEEAYRAGADFATKRMEA